MKLLNIVIACLVANLLPAEAVAQNLWQNLNVGMSVTEVRAAQPTAILVAKPEALATGATDELQIPETQFDGVPFEARFFFLDARLVQVNLTAKSRVQRADYDRLVNTLKAKHGPETSSGPTAIGQQTRWDNVAGISIGLNYLSELGYRLYLNFGAHRPT